PAGLTAALSGSTITVNGTPTSTGTFNINATVNDANGAIANAGFSLTINAAPTLGALSSTAWTVNQSGVSGPIPVTGGTGPVGGLTATGLPPGLTASLSGSTITLSGTPTATGYYYPVTLGVVDAAGARVSSSYALTINAPMTMGTLTANQWTVGQTG